MLKSLAGITRYKIVFFADTLGEAMQYAFPHIVKKLGGTASLNKDCYVKILL
jgi:hypothetical protein